jgi:hypothetical protein
VWRFAAHLVDDIDRLKNEAATKKSVALRRSQSTSQAEIFRERH